MLMLYLVLAVVIFTPAILGIAASRIEKEDGRNHFGGRIKPTPREKRVGEVVAVVMATGLAIYAGVVTSNSLFFLFAAGISIVGALIIWLGRPRDSPD